MAVKNKMLRRPQLLACFRDTSPAVATTLAAAAAVGATSITLTSGVGFVAGDRIRIDAGEDVEYATIDTLPGVANLKKPLVKAHANGAAVAKVTGHVVGETEGGVTVGVNVESTDVQSDMRRLVYNTLAGFETVTLDTRIYGLTLYTWCVVLGLPFSKISGSRTSSAPRVLATDFTDADTAGEQSVGMVSVLQDGTLKVDELMGVNIDYTAVSVALSRGNPGSVPLRASCYGRYVEEDVAAGGSADWAATALTTNTPSKDDVVQELTSLGYYTASGTPTTANGAIAAGATTIVCTDASGIAAEDWILLDTGAALETHWVLSKAVETLTLKTKVLNAHATGVRVVKAAQTLFSGIARGSAQIQIGGQTTDDFVEDRQLSIGKNPTTAQATITFALRDLTVAARALALGKPSGDIVSSRTVLSENLGTSAVEAVFAYGKTKGNVVLLWNFWGAAQQLQNFASTWGGQPDQAVTPFSFRPSSGLQMLEYAS